MEDGDNLQGDEAGRVSIWNLFKRKSFAARKSAPTIAPPAYDINGHDSDSSDDELPEPVSESNGTRDPPSRRLREPRFLPKVSEEDLLLESAGGSQPSSPTKSVHFSDDLVDTAQESAILLQKARSRRSPSIRSSHGTRLPPGKISKPSIIASSRYNGKIDESSVYDTDKLGEGNRKHSIPSNNDQRSESEQSREEPLRDELENGQSLPIMQMSRKAKWTNEEALKVAVLRDAGRTYEEIQKFLPHRSVRATKYRDTTDRKRKSFRVSNTDRHRILKEYEAWLSSQQNAVPARSRKRSAEQEGFSPSNIRSSKRLRINDESERSSKTAAAEVSSRTVRHMERESRQREAEIDNVRNLHDDAEDEIPDAIGQPEMDQMEDDPIFEPEIHVSPPVIVREHPREQAAKAAAPRQIEGPSRPVSNGTSTSHHSQVAGTAKIPRASRSIRRGADKLSDEAEADAEENEQEKEDEGQDEIPDVEVEEEPTLSIEPDRLWGHQTALDKIFSYIEEYREARKEFYDKRYRRKNELRAIKEICELCGISASGYEDLQVISSYDGPSEPDERQIEQSLPDVLKLVEELNPDDEGEDEDNRTKAAAQVYLYVFPALIHLLQAAVKYHCSIIAPDGPHAMLSFPGLASLGKIFSIIDTLDQRSKDWKTKPKLNDKVHVVKDMRNKVTIKLREIAQDLSKRASILRKRDDDLQMQKLEAEAARRRRELERRQEEERSIMREKMARLGNLYFERLKVEPNIYRQSQLRTPKFGDRRPELDANGEPFERVSMFQHQYSNHVHHEWEDGEQEWQDDEHQALIDGLKTFYGSKRFWVRIFQKYCGRDGPLRDRKVHEMLRQAKLMRNIWIQADQEQGWATEDYILNIPDLDLLDLL